ncbi:MAG: glycosyltransferase, partial [Candidatus Aureabacteria bacterium]|nr:glycosyltransferase [Candidatus Auribacterota bacterium]
ARRILGIASPRPMVMIMGGWSGWGALDRLAMEIQRLNRDADIVVVAGRNREMHRALTRHASMPGSRLRVLEYVDRVDLLMRAADVLVGKAGGMTSAEALAAGLPAVLVHILPGQERANASFLCGHGAAVAATGPANAAAIVARLIHEPSLREAMSLSACAVARPGAASTIVRSVLEGAHASLYCV